MLLFASGNDRGFGIDGDYQNHRVILVWSARCLENGAHTDYSTPSYALLTCAPGGSSGAGIVTVDRTGQAGYNAEGDYTEKSGSSDLFGFPGDVQGTSFSSPIVAGVAAQILSVRPAFTWRDVMEILARTAVKNDAKSI